MNRSKVIRLVIFVVLAAALFALFLLLKKKQTDEPKKQDTNTFFVVTTVDTESVDRILLKNDEFEGTFVRKDGLWTGGQELLNQTIWEQIRTSFLKNLKALAKLENPAADSEYGLDKPSGVLEAFSGDQRLVKIILGDKVPTQNRYYCRFNDEPTVYTVSSMYHDYLVQRRAYYVSKVETPSIAAVRYITEVSVEGELFPAFHAIKDAKNPYDYSGAGVLSWSIQEPYRATAFADTTGENWVEQLEKYLSFSYESAQAITPDRYAEYGLTNPKQKITVRYTNTSGTENNSYTLLIGDQTAEGSYYAKLQNADVLFTLAEWQVKFLCETDAFKMTYQPVFFPGYTSMSEITIKTSDTTYVFTHTKDADGNDVYDLNGIPVESSVMMDWASYALSVRATGYQPTETPDEEPYMTISVKVIPDTMKDMEVKIYRGQGGMDIMERFGVCDFCIDSRSVDEFIKYMKGMLGVN